MGIKLHRRTSCDVQDADAGQLRVGEAGVRQPGSRVIENKHSNRGRSTTYIQGECSYRRAEEEEEEVQRGWSGGCAHPPCQEPQGDHARWHTPPDSGDESAVRTCPVSASMINSADRWFTTASSGASGDGTRV